MGESTGGLAGSLVDATYAGHVIPAARAPSKFPLLAKLARALGEEPVK